MASMEQRPGNGSGNAMDTANARPICSANLGGSLSAFMVIDDIRYFIGDRGVQSAKTIMDDRERSNQTVPGFMETKVWLKERKQLRIGYSDVEKRISTNIRILGIDCEDDDYL